MVRIIAEIGINHNGDIELAKQLIKVAKDTGCHYAKFQKRTPELCVPDHQKSVPKDTPWGNMTYLEYKQRIEFDKEQLDELYEYASSINIPLFASVWDIDSVDVMVNYTDVGKIPSALITNTELCRYARSKFKTLIVSTGMSTEDEVVNCINTCNPDVVMHTNSTYPCPPFDLNLNYIKYLQQKYPDKQIGYSCHEIGLVTTFAAVALGAEWIERHLTLDKTMWGSDHSASIEPNEMIELVKGINEIEESTKYVMGPRILFDLEDAKKKTLRG